MRSHCNTYCVAVTWTIKKISTKHDKIELTNTFAEQFNIPGDWNIYLYPNGYRKGDENYTGQMIIYNKADASDNVHTKLKFSIVQSAITKTPVLTFERDLYENGEGHWFKSLGQRSDILDPKNFMVHDDRLVIMCEVNIGDLHILCSKRALKDVTNRLTEFNDFEKLWCNEESFTDVTLVVDDEKIPAHKNILSSRSSVFEAMFKHEMQESANNEVIIEDVKVRVMKELLRFMYCGKVEDIHDIAYDLLAAGNRYDVRAVKGLCEASLCRTLKNENAIEYLELADMHEAPVLKAEVIKYMVKNSKEIVQLPNFNWLANNLNSSLLVELLGAAFQKR